MTTTAEVFKQFQDLIKEVERLESEQRQLKFAVITILHRTLAGGNGAYTSEFGPHTLGTLLKITGFDMKNRLILKRKEGYDVKSKKKKLCPSCGEEWNGYECKSCSFDATESDIY